MRRLVAVAAVLAAAAAAGSVHGAPKPPQPAFVLAGGGWGHGVGMSQWGALGQAKAGRDYRTILGHYYRGTQIGSAPTSILERVRVLVGDGLAKVTVTNALAAFDANGKRYVLPVGPVTLGPKLQLPVGAAGKQLALPGPVRSWEGHRKFGDTESQRSSTAWRYGMSVPKMSSELIVRPPLEEK